MFNRLTDFSYKRTGKEAFGFYLFYVLVTIILCGIVGGIAAAFGSAGNFQEGFVQGMKIGPYVSGLICFVISSLLLVRKNLLKPYYFLLLPLVSGLLGFAIGCFFGLIVPAYLTKKDPAGD
jgi:hypothetical protein